MWYTTHTQLVMKMVRDIASHHEISKTCHWDLSKNIALDHYYETCSYIEYIEGELQLMNDCLAHLKIMKNEIGISWKFWSKSTLFKTEWYTLQISYKYTDGN